MQRANGLPRGKKSQDHSIEEYKRKRDFEVTPEPPPAVAKPSPQLKFCVQRHDATRLHYDFRLEVDGVLKSWAVPKGPSLDPTKKNLAMHVEDHPMEYGGFEGNIPKGEYGGGSVMLWDRGTYEVLGDIPARDQLKRGDFKIRLHGEKLKGDFAIVLMKGRGKGNEWLLIKKRDEHAQLNWDVEAHARSVLTGRSQEEIAADLPAKASKEAKGPKRTVKLKPSSIKGAVKREMPRSITPMSAQLASRPPGGKGWLYEVKWDGVRALCFVEDGEVYILSRTGNRCERQYPEIQVLPHHLAASTAIVDGEIAALDDNGRATFSRIQPRIHQTDPNSIAHLTRSTPVTLFAFDLLYWDGYDLRGAELSERKRALEAILTPDGPIRLSQHFTADGDAVLEAARQAGLEGIMAKEASSKYESRRSRCWVKVKIHNEQEFVIAGFTHGDRDYFSSLVLGVYEGDTLVHTGQVGTGFNDRTIRELHARLQPLVMSKSPFGRAPKIPRGVTWVRPELVCQVRFVEWTPDQQLRAPSFQGLREDIDPTSVRREGADPDREGSEPEMERGPLLSADQKEAVLTIGRQTVKFTNLNKAYYPKDGYSKRDVINYYDAVADLLVPHLRDRPLSMKRYPNGIESEFFFQKNAEDFPSWIRLEPIPSDNRVINYAICNDRETLLYMANLGCIDQNPWMSRVQSLDKPDFMLIDLDPQECPYDMIVEAALLVRQKLDQVGLSGYPKTTGGDGMHIYVPLANEYTYEQVRSFCEILSHLVVGENPDLFTTPRSVAKRKKGRVYFDYLQIAESKTISAPYVLRAYPGAPVSTPLDWREVKPGLLPQQFTIENAPARFAAKGDIFKPVLENKQRLEDSIRRLQKLMG